MEKLCVICKHFYYSGWSRGYSELTPGGDESMGCGKGMPQWSIEKRENIYTDEYRELIRSAETCPEFVPAKD